MAQAKKGGAPVGADGAVIPVQERVHRSTKVRERACSKTSAGCWPKALFDAAVAWWWGYRCGRCTWTWRRAWARSRPPRPPTTGRSSSRYHPSRTSAGFAQPRQALTSAVWLAGGADRHASDDPELRHVPRGEQVLRGGLPSLREGPWSAQALPPVNVAVKMC